MRLKSEKARKEGEGMGSMHFEFCYENLFHDTMLHTE
jgi:hypothetical protein